MLTFSVARSPTPRTPFSKTLSRGMKKIFGNDVVGSSVNGVGDKGGVLLAKMIFEMLKQLDK